MKTPGQELREHREVMLRARQARLAGVQGFAGGRVGTAAPNRPSRRGFTDKPQPMPEPLAGVVAVSGETITCSGTSQDAESGALIWTEAVPNGPTHYGFEGVAFPASIIPAGHVGYYDVRDLVLTLAEATGATVSVHAVAPDGVVRNLGSYRGPTTWLELDPHDFALGILSNESIRIVVDQPIDTSVPFSANFRLVERIATAAAARGIWWTDFSEYAVSSSRPEGWSKIAGSTSPVAAPWGIKERADSTGGKILYHPAGDGWEWIGWDAPPVGTDMEVVARVRSPSTSDSMGVLVRASQGNAYGLIANPSSNWLRIFRIVNDVPTQIANLNISVSSSTWYWLRFRASGSLITGRIWAAGGSEPSSWSVQAMDGTVGSGRVGVGPWPSSPGNTNTERQVDVVGIGYGGDPAPMENI
jgi:hypothetical protein